MKFRLGTYVHPPHLFGPTPPINCKVLLQAYKSACIAAWWYLRVSAVCVLVTEIIEFRLQLHLLQRKYPAHNSPAELSRLWLTSLRVKQSYMYQRNLPVI